jgi:hypothetical protein
MTRMITGQTSAFVRNSSIESYVDKPDRRSNKSIKPRSGPEYRDVYGDFAWLFCTFGILTARAASGFLSSVRTDLKQAFAVALPRKRLHPIDALPPTSARRALDRG